MYIPFFEGELCGNSISDVIERDKTVGRFFAAVCFLYLVIDEETAVGKEAL
jgi:hypothetical protein